MCASIFCTEQVNFITLFIEEEIHCLPVAREKALNNYLIVERVYMFTLIDE